MHAFHSNVDTVCMIIKLQLMNSYLFIPKQIQKVLLRVDAKVE